MIDISNIKFTYDGSHLVINDVSARIAPGEFVCILGGNGSGKSTLAKHMNALLVPDEGTVNVNGESTADEDALYLIRSTAGMVFQNPDDQLVASLVEDDVAFGPENLGREPAEIAQRVREALAEVGLTGFERHETHALSGGQKQRVAIAGVLAMRPKVLILDEASSMLDPRGRSGLMRVCRELNAAGMTIVMITHFMEEAAQAQRVIVLERGRIAASGAPEEVLVQTDLLERLNLEMPFATKLSSRLRKAGADVPACIDEAHLVESVMGAYQRAQAQGTETGEKPVAEGANEGSAAESAEAATEGEKIGGCCVDGAFDAARAKAEDPSPHAPANTTGPACAPAADQATASGATPLPEPVITFENVSFTYDAAAAKKARKQAKDAAPEKLATWGNSPDALWAVRDVSFSVRRGEFFGVAGHTGSGKSTLIQHMNAILHPTAGRVLVCGEDVADKKRAAAVRAKVGVVFQYPEHQLFAATVYDDVAFGPRNLGLPPEEVDARVRESLARVALDFDALKDASPFELSGGQQRRVAFAGVLAMNPEILVLDEPVAGLDPAARRDFLALISGLHAQGLTVVMVSHNMDDLAAHCDCIAVMKEGRLARVGTPQEVFLHAEEMKSIGLGVPAAQHAANSLKAAGFPLVEGVLYNEETLARAISHLVGEGEGCANSPTAPENRPAPQPNPAQNAEG